MRFGRIVIATIVLTILNGLYAWLTCGWLFKWVYSLEPISVWVTEASMTGSFFFCVYLGNLVLLFLFVLIFNVLYGCIPGACRACKGAMYGLLVWLLGGLPGMFMIHMFMTVNKTVVVYWLISGLVWLLISGVIVGMICGEKEGTGGCCA